VSLLAYKSRDMGRPPPGMLRSAGVGKGGKTAWRSSIAVSRAFPWAFVISFFNSLSSFPASSLSWYAFPPPRPGAGRPRTRRAGPQTTWPIPARDLQGPGQPGHSHHHSLPRPVVSRRTAWPARWTGPQTWQDTVTNNGETCTTPWTRNGREAGVPPESSASPRSGTSYGSPRRWETFAIPARLPVAWTNLSSRRE